MMQQRQLAAIFFTDIVGYTAMMQKNEAHAVVVIKRYNTVLEKSVAAYRGEVVNYYGDGSLCIFQSAIEAVQCAIEVQAELKKDPQVPLRIGLHIGEVFFENGKALGDGVNLASRVQSLGQENTILVSEEIHNKISNHPEFKLVSLGTFEFKNVGRPMEVFAIANEGLFVPQKKKLEGKLKEKKSINKKPIIASIILLLIIIAAFFIYKRNGNKNSLDKDKSIAVLPFKNESTNKEENEPFCNGVTLEILKNLTWMNELQPIAPQSVENYRDSKMSIADIAKELGVKYIVQGTVQRYKNEVKVFASLINAEDGRQIWADDFPGQMENVFALQADIAQKIAVALRIKITPAEKSLISRVSTTNIKALDAYNEAVNAYVKLAYSFLGTYEAMSQKSKIYEDYLNTLALCNKVTELDPNMAEPYALKAKTYIYKYTHDNFTDQSNLLDTISALGNKAIALDENSVDGYVVLARYFEESNKNDSALMNIEKALAISPNNFDANWKMGEFYESTDFEKSLRFLRKALRLDPSSVWTPQVYHDMGSTYENLCDFDKAESYYKKAFALSSNSFTATHSLFQIGNIYLHWGKPDSAIKYAQQLLLLKDSNALYQLAEAYCNLKNECDRSLPLYDQLWKTFQGHVNEHRWAIALWKTGQKEKAMQLIEKSFERYKKMFPNSYDLAGMYVFKGDKANAYAILEKFDWLWGSPYLIQHDPLFDNIRNDQQFKDLLKKVLDDRAKARERIGKLEEKGEL